MISRGRSGAIAVATIIFLPMLVATIYVYYIQGNTHPNTSQPSVEPVSTALNQSQAKPLEQTSRVKKKQAEPKHRKLVTEVLPNNDAVGSSPCNTRELAEFYDIPFTSHADEDVLLPSYEYLSLLGDDDLHSLANDGYRDALALLGDRLIHSDEKEDVIQGRDLLYKASIRGSVYSLTGLSMSHYADYLSYLETGQDALAADALLQFHTYRYLVELSAPGALSNDVQLSDAYKLSDEQRTRAKALQSETLTQFNRDKQALGLAPLNPDAPPVAERRFADNC